jgi:hypothetical protein
MQEHKEMAEKGAPAYHPVYRRPSDSWYPSNRAADLLIHLNHIWGDMEKLSEIRLKHKDDKVAEKLLFKYVLVEFRSLLEPLRELQTIIKKAEPLVKGKPAPSRYVTKRERENCQTVFKEFWRSLRIIEADLYLIRNDIGAHRGLHPWQHVEGLWEKIDPDKFTPVINQFLPVWNAVEHLNIYEWSRSFGDNSFSILGCRIVHDWENAYTEDEIQKPQSAASLGTATEAQEVSSPAVDRASHIEPVKA